MRFFILIYYPKLNSAYNVLAAFAAASTFM